MARLGPIGRDGEPLIARGNELDRAVEPAGRERNERGARRHGALGPERTADKMAHHMNLVGIDAEALGDAVLEAIDELARLVDGELVAFPHAGGGEQLKRIVMLRRGAVFRVDRDVRGGERGLGVTLVRQLAMLRGGLGGVLDHQAV